MLSAAFVNTVKDVGRYHDNQGAGLFLRVRKTGNRYWVQRINIRGKRREIGLGAPPFVSLAEARQIAIDNKRIALNDGDPLHEKRKNKNVPTFTEAIRLTHQELKASWKTEKEQMAFLAAMEKHMGPYLGAMLVSAVTSADVRRAILDAREKVPAVAAKLTYRTSQVFKWAIAEDYRLDNPALAANLALPKLRSKAQNYKALPYDQVAGCVASVQKSGAWVGTKLALEFVILTAARSGEVRSARWSEIDRNAWRIPGERMKMGREHLVPMSSRAIEILREAESIKDASGLIFPSARSKVMSDMTLSKLIRGLGFDAHVHGFRASFRTWAQEQTNTPREVAEAALAHVSGDQVERAYARSDLFEKRIKLMDQWASYLAIKRGELVQFGAG
ncbi:tyrosine-type recombinase/integrase [Rhodobacteraceae bacterium R_SAG10]|nr:tyrosine-type recombinase/integrase [Rhodobacteraceae bacterium R_SAG10]